MFLRFGELRNAPKSSPRAMPEASAISMRFRGRIRVDFESILSSESRQFEDQIRDLSRCGLQAMELSGPQWKPGATQIEATRFCELSAHECD